MKKYSTIIIVFLSALLLVAYNNCSNGFEVTAFDKIAKSEMADDSSFDDGENKESTDDKDEVLPVIETGVRMDCAGDWQARHPDWLWCDDFEKGNLRDRYYEHHDNNGNFDISKNSVYAGESALETRYPAGTKGVGRIIYTFGKNPLPGAAIEDENYQEVYWRFFYRVQEGWQGQPNKVTRVTMFTKSDWGQGMLAHLWEGGSKTLGVDPVSLFKNSSTESLASGINDWDQMKWLGHKNGVTNIYSSELAGQWHCIELHTKLNTLGSSNGIFEFWINGEKEVTSSNLNFRANYSKHGLNAIYLESYWNQTSPVSQSRYFDNFVVSKNRIGCH